MKKKYRAGGQNPPQEDPKKKKATSLPPAPKPFGSMDAVRRTPSVMTPGEKAAAAAAAQARVTADSTKFFDDKWRYPEWQRYEGNASRSARAIGAGEIARKKERERSAKKYSNGGQNPPQNKPTYGPPKPPGYKEPSKEEMKERQDEASYNKMRKELDRELASMKKRGATEDQINKYADKMISAWARNR